LVSKQKKTWQTRQTEIILKTESLIILELGSLIILESESFQARNHSEIGIIPGTGLYFSFSKKKEPGCIFGSVKV